MTTQPLAPDPNGLPVAPTRGCPVSAAMFDLLLAAARKGGWPAVFTVFAQGETTTEPMNDDVGVRERPARRRTLAQFLDKRPDLKALLDSAAQERRDHLLSRLEDEVETIALGPGDVTQDFGKDGEVTRVRVDRRNKLHALLKLLASHDPDTYAERKKLDATVSGQVNHQHSLGNRGGYTISPDDVRSLEPHEQAQLMSLLQRIEDVRTPRALPEVIDVSSREHRE